MSKKTTPVAPVQNIVHTPGPWKYHSAGVMVMDSEGQMSIADIRGWGTLEKQYGEQKAMQIQDANGRLIAAAPELLVACQLLFEHINEGLVTVFEEEADNGQPGVSSLELIEAAIRKATQVV